MRVSLSELPQEITLEEAVEAAYWDDLEQLERAVDKRWPVLLEVDPELMPYLHRVLVRRLAQRPGPLVRCHYVSGAPKTVSLGPLELEVSASLTDQMRREVFRLVRESDPNQLIIIPHFELLATAAAAEPSREARELAALLHDHPEARVLALYAPDVEPPPHVARIFRLRGGIGLVPGERVPHVVLQREGRKLGVGSLEVEDLLESLGRVNVIQLRQALEVVAEWVDFDPRGERAQAEVYAQLTALVRDHGAVTGIPPAAKRGDQEWVMRSADS